MGRGNAIMSVSGGEDGAGQAVGGGGFTEKGLAFIILVVVQISVRIVCVRCVSVLGVREYTWHFKYCWWCF